MVRMVWECEVETKNGMVVVMGAHSGVITCERLVLCVWGRGRRGCVWQLMRVTVRG